MGFGGVVSGAIDSATSSGGSGGGGGGSDILGALIAGGAQVGTAALLSDQNIPAPLESQPPDLSADPLFALSAFDALLSLGQLDPSLIFASSPIEQSRRAIETSVSTGAAKRGALGALAEIQSLFASGLDISEIAEEISKRGAKRFDRLLQVSGFGSVGELIAAEQVFRENAESFVQDLGPLADQIRQGRLSAIRQRGELVGDLPVASASELARLTGLERERIQSDLADIRSRALRQGNITGVNPGTQLEALDQFEASDLELEALRSATKLLGGQQQVASSSLGLLNEAIDRPSQFATGLASIRETGQPFAFSGGPISSNQALIAGLNSGFATIGAGIADNQFIDDQLANLKNSIFGTGATRPATGDQG